MAPDIAQLIAALDTDDARAQQTAGQHLLDAGKEALPALLAAIDSPSPQVRKAVTYVLGRSKPTPEVVAALVMALRDPEPKVRKNVAIALGTLGDPAAVAPLAYAAARETITWIRPSLALAIGAIGGTDAYAALQGIEPRDDREREARQKALDRTAPRQARSAWRDGVPWQLPLLMDAPIGLERVAVEEATAQGFPGCRIVMPGLLGCPDGIAPWQLVPTLRCVYGVLIDGGRGEPLPLEQPDAAVAATEALLQASIPLRTLSEWLDVGDEPVRYRFSAKGEGMPRTLQRPLLEAARAVCSTFGMRDSPSNYDLELNLFTDAKGSRLTIRPSFMADGRFVYRHKDVGASINPVVAAGLARMVRVSERAQVFDPTCGSGTLLIERAFLDGQTRLRGLDISGTAINAARTNSKAARMDRRIMLATGDAASPTNWSDYDEVIANLPWGMRTRKPGADLPLLYRTVVAELAKHLRSGGRAVLYSVNAQLIEAALDQHKRALKVEGRRRIFSGGVWSTAWLIGTVG